MRNCEFCGKEFEPRRWFRKYCSVACKNPSNRRGHIPWNKGLTKEDPRVLKNITSQNRIPPPAGWNTGNKTKAAKIASAAASIRMRERNPNHNGICNLKRTNKPQPKGWKLYVKEVRKFTMRTKRIIQKKSNIKFGKKSNDWQLDHIIPLKQGYELNIPPYIIGNKYNVQILKQKENRKKWDEFQSKEMINEIISIFEEEYRYELFRSCS